MHNKRRNNMNGGGNGPHRHHNNNNNRPRRFGNNRPQGGEDPANVARTRRNAVQNREKYQMMARDALSSGDRVLAEYYLQHADHYHRVILSLPPEEAPRPQYLRGFNPQGDGEQPGEPNAQDGALPAHSSGGHQDDGQEAIQMPSTGHALPSFITQPTNISGNPEGNE